MTKNTLIKPGMRIAVIGLGLSGRAAVRYLLACGAEVIVSDNRREPEFVAGEGGFLRETGVAWEAGGHRSAFFAGVDMVFVSPGVPLHLPLLQELRGRGVAIVGELAVAAPVLSDPVIAITGTNGKTTVTTLIGQLLQGAGKNAFVGGNIGTPLFHHLLDETGADAVVLEVSSFQLDTAGSFRPDIALLLNITPDHIDRHGSLAGYSRAKLKIFANQGAADTAIVNGDDPLCRQALAAIAGRVLLFGHTADCQARIKGDRILLAWPEVESYDLAGSRLANAIGLMNAAAAILAARAAGCSRDDILAGLLAFQPLRHRVEEVAQIDGITYYDDSKATNTGAVLAALAQVAGKVVLIAGGRDKGEDYALLQEGVRNKARRVILIGEAADQIAAALVGTAPLDRAATMEEAVGKAQAAARPGDAVLLSPACASFDMFTSYAHRGDVFAAAVRGLKGAAAPVGSGGEV
ncbi:UDP-N-acetylmuramoyl-L-alanine--D-glutamate ligase [Desulfoprunum benzoelyticum]|uniref:UDP-N-acetylmuramoylalanine--D-glutamate ligase n=1 Tax=Desulfoprunum benzoelyticum TaxID=1506996 RepID=A0A840V398_9BACT|nr:UDP-N-acetylmuramoyl-L-alanine--D-glutamate ligase [Desulfoprunum benzoelyticum]MBB5347611.1 UDP-N-acetylmuramoylalanine--D-glutamate ligase [Desulfoprunum benzoelyticum]MBM9529260.1 UDP-N-acetylmuramoyl-L-alanine--D-glutamate ligase [Desulfoprunum benzoelyticum]